MRKHTFCCIVVLPVLLALPAFATISQYQSAATWNTTNTTTCVVPFGKNTQLNDLIAVWTTWQATSTFTASVKDSPSQNNTYYSAVGPTLQSVTNTSAQIFYAKNLQTAGSDTVTVTYTGTVSSASCVIVEYSGLDQNYPLDSVSAGYSTSGNKTALLDSGNVAPANSNLLVFGGGISDSGTPYAGGGFTPIQSSGGAITEQDIITGNTSLQRATACLNSAAVPCPASPIGNWLMQMAVFRDASWNVQGGWIPARANQIHYADQFGGTTVGAQIQNADAACSGIACGVWVVNFPLVSAASNNFPSSPSATSTYLDLRTQQSSSGIMHNALNITDGLYSSSWLKANSGGLGGTKLFVGMSPSSLVFPGNSATLSNILCPSGTVAAPPPTGNTGCGGLTAIATTQGSSDYFTNATFTNPISVVGFESNVSVQGASSKFWDLYGITSGIFEGATFPTATTAGRLIDVSSTGLGSFPSTFHAGKYIGIYGYVPGVAPGNNTYTGTVTVGSCSSPPCSVTWASGDEFYSNVSVTHPISLNGTPYPIGSISSPTSMTIGCGTGYNVCPSSGTYDYTILGEQRAGEFYGNTAFMCNDPAISVNDACVQDPRGFHGIATVVNSNGNAYQKAYMADVSSLESDGTYARKSFDVSGGRSPATSWGTYRIMDHAGSTVLFSVSEPFSGGPVVSTPGQLQSTVPTGTPPLIVASTTNVANLNASSLNGATFAAPGSIGNTTPGTGTFATLTISNDAGTVTTAGTQVNAGTCQAQTALALAGVTTSHAVAWSFAGVPPATWLTGITVLPSVQSGQVTIYLCNSTAASITPVAATLNVRVIR